MSEGSDVVGPDLFLGLNDRPNPAKTLLAATAHLFAIVASILTAPLLIARAVGLDADATQYVISASLVVSGIATFIQTFRIGIVGSGLLAVQGTSFAFIGTMAYAASQLPLATPKEELLGILLGTAAVGGGMVVVLSFFLNTVRKVITPTVTGVTICLLGLSLLWSAMNNSWRLLSSADQGDVLPLAFEWLFTLTTIALLATRKNPYARLTCVPAGLFAGLLLAALLRGWSVPAAELDQPLFFLQLMPVPLKFSPVALMILLPIFLVSLTETIGDITATSLVSKQPIEGKAYFRRLRGGVLGDGFNTVLASLFGAFPNTTFSQNNAVIRLTSIASRQVGYVLAALLVVLGSIPAVSSLVVNIPGSVLNSTTAFLFAMIAYTGLEIVLVNAKKKGLRVLIFSTCSAFGLIFVPQLLLNVGVETPAYASILMGFPVATGAVIAIVADKLIR